MTGTVTWTLLINILNKGKEMKLIKNKSLMSIMVLFLLNLFCMADVPMDEIDKLHKTSPEKLTIKVINVEKKEKDNNFYIVAVAKITNVEFSKSGLKKKDIIEIKYTLPNHKKNMTPGSWPSLLAKNGNYKAYISLKHGFNRIYEPSALSGSFILIPD